MMALQRFMYNLMYRRGAPRWETGVIPAPLVELIEGEQALPPGRALDLGCGTGPHVRYLAQHGWEATGVDFSSTAIRMARARASDLRGVSFVEGDVSRLDGCGVNGPFNLVIDIGCYHGVPAAQRGAYVDELARVTADGSLFLLWAIDVEPHWWTPGVLRSSEREIRQRFAPRFALLSAQPGSIFSPESGKARWPAKWYVMRRQCAAAEGRTTARTAVAP
jgi:SAM-dependent methyltransferase